MSLPLPCYQALCTESNNARMKFYNNKRKCSHFNRNPKYRQRIKRYESYKHHQIYKPNPIFINNTITNVRTIATTHNETNRPEKYEITSINDENPFDIYSGADTEMVEFS